MLKETIEKDFITAFKEKDALKKNTLGILKSEITKTEKGGTVKEITDEVIFGILASEIKKRNQTIVMITGKSGMEDTLDVLGKEIVILQAYLPAQMSETEMTIEINKILAIPDNAGKNVMGLIMKEFANNFKGKYDNKKLKELIEGKK